MIHKNEKGFTLIELLVVVAIIGILAAIAIPQFAAYRQSAFCSKVESDVANTVIALEGFYADNQTYTGFDKKVQSQGVDVATTAAGNDIGTVTGSTTDATQCPKGTYTFTGATGTYNWP